MENKNSNPSSRKRKVLAELSLDSTNNLNAPATNKNTRNEIKKEQRSELSSPSWSPTPVKSRIYSNENLNALLTHATQQLENLEEAHHQIKLNTNHRRRRLQLDPVLLPDGPKMDFERPSLGEMEEHLNFRFIQPDHQPQYIKYASYSEITNKIYLGRNKVFRVLVDCPDVRRYKTTLFLRGMLVYGSPQLRHVAVEKCRDHAAEEADHPASAQIVKLLNEYDVRYFNISNRTGFILPVKSDSSSVALDVSFSCFNTCLKGNYQWRNWKLLVTLETAENDGVILARKSLAVKVCAAPKRERQVEENTFVNSVNFNDRATTAAKMASSSISPINNGSSSSKFKISVDNEEDYKLLTAVKNELKSNPLLKSILLTQFNKINP